MAIEYLKASYFIQELEEASGKILCDLVFLSRLANISLGIMAKAAPREEEDVDLYFHTRRTIDKLQLEANRQLKLLNALKKELMHTRDGDTGGLPAGVLVDYEKAEAV